MIRNMVFWALVVGSFNVHAEDAPKFDAERLTIPRVDANGRVAQYQNATLVRLPTGDFRLEAVDVLEVGKLYQLSGIQGVEVRTVGARPVSVLLRVTGADPSCDHVSPLRYSQRLTGNRFDVVISSLHYYDRSPTVGCTDNYRPFRVTVPLDVYGLAAGTYTFTVNGANTGQFVLPAENRYADDCHVTLERQCPNQLKR